MNYKRVQRTLNVKTNTFKINFGKRDNIRPE